ncbi:MAG: hypothetical protein R3321_00895 [Nitrososphaeraceae archaeon]|nr:hypothetical protein [Nitrososphaeraceae archaeon]
MLVSEEMKILVSNGLLENEEKFQAKDEIKARCVIIANTNSWDANLVYNLDPGIISRVKLLSTYYNSELQRVDPYVEAVGCASEDLRPHHHINWLAEKLDVDKEAIMLWALRLATDRFYEVITREVKPGTNPLEIEVRKWTSRCRIRFKADSTQALINAMVVSMIMRNADQPGWDLPELTPEVLADGLYTLYYLITDLSTTKLITSMKGDWEETDRPPTHFYEGFREIVPKSLKDASDTYKKYMEEPPSQRTAMTDMVKHMMGKVVLRDGFKISPGMSYLVEFWKRSRFNLEDLKDKAGSLLMDFEMEYPNEFQCMMDNWANQPCDSWMDDPNYSPKDAEKLKREYTKKDSLFLKRMSAYTN